jgi:hypothetical protein
MSDCTTSASAASGHARARPLARAAAALCARRHSLTGCRSLPTIALRCDCCVLSKGSPVRALPLASASVRLRGLARLMGLKQWDLSMGNHQPILESHTVRC